QRTVTSSHRRQHYIGRLSATGPHRRKGCVAGGVKEGDHAAISLHMIGTDMLSNTTGFAGGHLGTTDIVEQRGLAVVYVTHDGHYRSAADFLAFKVHGFCQTVFQLAFTDMLVLVTQVFGDDGRSVLIQN